MAYRVNQWDVFYVNDVPDGIVGMKKPHDFYDDKKVIDQLKRRHGLYKALIVSSDIVNHNFDISTAVVLYPPKDEVLWKYRGQKIYPTEFLLPKDLHNEKLRENIVMAHTIHSVSHRYLMKKIGDLLHEERLREPIREIIRFYLDI
jgi:mRNA-degrading endonuclease toxin of MazEF toxin-antitoxin module